LKGSRTGSFSLIRELLKDNENVITICQVEGILEITLHGFAVVTSRFLEGMKKNDFVLEDIRNSIDPEFLSLDLDEPLRMECEHDVPIFVWTIIRFKDTELPPLENDDGKSDNEIITIEKQFTNNKEAEEMDLEINSPIQEGVNN
jgi:hypothetical protein